jgi:polyisoprenoid-binding protein YceI
MKKIFIIAIAVFTSYVLQAQTKWTVDFAHSSIKFSVVHLVISEVEGSFKTYTGSVVSTTPDFEGAAIDFTIEAKSINTENEMRDNHLRSADFFDVEKFPQITFKSKTFKKVSDNKYLLTGDLTLHDVTKEVKFDATYGGTIKDARGGIKSGFKANTTINRLDYGLKWNPLTEAGGAVVSPEVQIFVKLELNQAK